VRSTQYCTSPAEGDSSARCRAFKGSRRTVSMKVSPRAMTCSRRWHTTVARTPYRGAVGSTVSRRRVLVIGLDPCHVPGPWDPKPVAQAIEIGLARLAEQGIEAEASLVGLEGRDDIEYRVSAALRAGRWDCVVVGGGIRKPEDQLELRVHREPGPRSCSISSDRLQQHTAGRRRCRDPTSPSARVNRAPCPSHRPSPDLSVIGSRSQR
jgi:hypothetical protein